jgi:hypothetical protein
LKYEEKKEIEDEEEEEGVEEEEERKEKEKEELSTRSDRMIMVKGEERKAISCIIEY